MLFVEHTESTDHNCNFIPVAELEGKTGFHTTAKFTPEQKARASAAGTIKVLRDDAVTLDALYVDFDDQPKHANAFRKWLVSEDINFEMDFSGNRSYHFKIVHTPLHHVSAPYTQKKFMLDTGLNFDKSFYHYAGLFRIRGTVHHKTGKPKELLEKHEGAILQLDVVEKPRKILNLDTERFAVAMIRTTTWLGTSPGNGNRHTTLWSLAMEMEESGISFDTALEILWNLNLSWGDEGHGAKEVERAVRQAYQH